jgi:cytochrome c oxidase subunit 2
MAITPPERTIWWNQPIGKVELIWIIIAFLWGLFMFGFMIAWHFIGQQNLNKEAYRIDPSTYEEKVDAFATKYKVREESGIPVVKPPAGTDIYLLGRLWQWWPILELEKGTSYRIHISSLDLMHGLSLQPVNINISVYPGYEHVISLTPTEAGEFGIVCNEFCGIGHHSMTGKIYIVDRKAAAAAPGLARNGADVAIAGGITP